MKRILFNAHLGTDLDKATLAYELVDTTSLDLKELVTQLQKKLKLREKENQEKDQFIQDQHYQIEETQRHNLLLNELMINNSKIEKTQVIYIATSQSYAAQNRFKVGGVEAVNKLASRLSTYNSRSAAGDDFYYSDVFLIADYRQIESRLKSLLLRFRDRASKEIYVLHYNNIQYIVNYFCDHYNEELDYVNEHLTEFINNLNRYDLRPVVPTKTSFNYACITTCQEDGRVINAVIKTNSNTDLVVRINEYVQGLTCMEISKKQVFDDLRIRTGRRELLPVLKNVFRQLRPDIILKQK